MTSGMCCGTESKTRRGQGSGLPHCWQRTCGIPDHAPTRAGWQHQVLTHLPSLTSPLGELPTQRPQNLSTDDSFTSSSGKKSQAGSLEAQFGLRVGFTNVEMSCRIEKPGTAT